MLFRPDELIHNARRAVAVLRSYAAFRQGAGDRLNADWALREAAIVEDKIAGRKPFLDR